MTEHLTEERVRAFALSLPEAAESSHHGTPDFRVRNKIFATLPPAGGAVNVKCRPEDVDAGWTPNRSGTLGACGGWGSISGESEPSGSAS